MSMIDVHMHVWIKEAGTGGSIQPDPDGEHLLRAMDEHGIDTCVLHGVPTRARPRRHVGDNPDVLRVVRKHPDRLLGSVYVNPRDTARSLETLEEYAEHGFRCVKMIPLFEGTYLDDPACRPVFEKIRELGLPVLVHMGPCKHESVDTFMAMDNHASHPLSMVNTVMRFPEIDFIIAHFAGHWFWDAVMLHSRYQNVYLDTSTVGRRSVPFDFLLDYEQRGTDPDRMRLLRLDNRVMFGLDLSADRYAEAIGDWRYFAEACGKPDLAEHVFYKTAARVFGLDRR